MKPCVHHRAPTRSCPPPPPPSLTLRSFLRHARFFHGLCSSLRFRRIELNKSFECKRVERSDLVDLQEGEVIDLSSKIKIEIQKIENEKNKRRSGSGLIRTRPVSIGFITHLCMKPIDGFDRRLALSDFTQVLQQRPHSIRKGDVVGSSREKSVLTMHNSRSGVLLFCQTRVRSRE
jgi:hypothetical protein